MFKSSVLKKIENEVRKEIEQIISSLNYKRGWDEYIKANNLETGSRIIKQNQDEKWTLVVHSYHCAQGPNEVLGVEVWKKYWKEGIAVKHDSWSREIIFYHAKPYPGSDDHRLIEDDEIISPALERV